MLRQFTVKVSSVLGVHFPLVNLLLINLSNILVNEGN